MRDSVYIPFQIPPIGTPVTVEIKSDKKSEFVDAEVIGYNGDLVICKTYWGRIIEEKEHNLLRHPSPPAARWIKPRYRVKRVLSPERVVALSVIGLALVPFHVLHYMVEFLPAGYRWTDQGIFRVEQVT